MSKYEPTFTIDLLNGQGVPQKTKPGGIVIAAATATLPVLLAIGTLGIYLNNKVALSLKEREVVKNEDKIDNFSEALEQRDALLKEERTYSTCLSVISSSIKKYSQWSPVLTTVVENMPESVVLTSLEVERKSVKKQVPDKDNPEQKKEVEVPYRILRLSVKGGAQNNCDEAVRDFQDRLRTSALLKPRLDDIRVSQKSEKIDGQDVFSYEITCSFKPRL
jgi:Tfp pilus assembly protein PilN